GYRLGTKSVLTGFAPDAGQPFGVKPVWADMEGIQIRAMGVNGQGDVDDSTFSEQFFAVRPEPGKPESLVRRNLAAQILPDELRYWNGMMLKPAYPGNQSGPNRVQNLYLLEDRFGNVIYGQTNATASSPQANVQASFVSQAPDGGMWGHYYSTSVTWNDTPSLPQGDVPITLAVNYPLDPDWSAGTVTKTLTLKFDGGVQKLLVKPTYSYDLVKPDGNKGTDDGTFPLSVSPGSTMEGLPKTAQGDTPRLNLLTIQGDQTLGLYEPKPEPTLGSTRMWVAEGSDHFRIQETRPTPTLDGTTAAFALTLVDDKDQPVPESEFLVHVCPRFDHESAEAPRPCAQAPAASTNGVVSSVSTLPGWGYLGIELTKAPLAPGTYYVKVESIGQTHRIRIAADRWDEAGGVANEFAGSFGLCEVEGAEILDENFDRTASLAVDRDRSAYVRWYASDASSEVLSVELESLFPDHALLDRLTNLTLRRLGKSSVYLSRRIDLYPPWLEASTSQTQPRIRVVGGGITAEQGFLKATRTSALASVAMRRSRLHAASLPSPKIRVRCRPAPYELVLGAVMRLRAYRYGPIATDAGPSQQYWDVCTPSAQDCPGATELPPAYLPALSGGPERPLGDVARLELENVSGGTEFRLRAIGLTVSREGQPRIRDGVIRITLTGTTEGIARYAGAFVKILAPVSFGGRTDGFRLSPPYPGAPERLHELVVDVSDKYGVPPHVLLAQVTKEAVPTGVPAYAHNPFSYRYEPYGFDFLYLTGDGDIVRNGTTRKLLANEHPFKTNGILATSGGVETLPSNGVDPPETPEEVMVTPEPVGTPPFRQYRIPASAAPPPTYWKVDLLDGYAGMRYEQVDPGFAGELAPRQFRFDARAGTIVLGDSPQHPELLTLFYRPFRRMTRAATPGFGGSLASAPSTAEIVAKCPTCDILPPEASQSTISAWAASRTSASHTLTQRIRRYGRDYPPGLGWNLMKEDPSFDIQGQWYAGASYGLLQLWPAKAVEVINRLPSGRRPEMYSLYDPFVEPATKLFDPRVSVEFAAAADKYANLDRPKEDQPPYPFERVCAMAEMGGVIFPNDCSWLRLWERRLRDYNGGRDGQESQATQIDYAQPITARASALSPGLE
ncbi:MAG: hypothetical protein IT186_19510, partial [Acidobacteria bacterium]|nr:hypothetical protein [Acidobacteriota bacterium]